jgi:hypothetical protein
MDWARMLAYVTGTVDQELQARNEYFIHLESRRVDIAGITIHPNEPWMKQMARKRDHGRMRHPTGLPPSPA